MEIILYLIIAFIAGLIVGRVLPRKDVYTFADDLCGDLPLHPTSRHFYGGKLDTSDKRYQLQLAVYNAAAVSRPIVPEKNNTRVK